MYIYIYLYSSGEYKATYDWEGTTWYMEVFHRSPQARWMVDFMENPNLKWMRTRGGPMT